MVPADMVPGGRLLDRLPEAQLSTTDWCHHVDSSVCLNHLKCCQDVKLQQPANKLLEHLSSALWDVHVREWCLLPLVVMVLVLVVCVCWGGFTIETGRQ